MDNKILGLHHITAIAGDAQRNYDFYTKVLGLRLVKKTVNFDDPGTYHFYYGDAIGTPGTILTFFPWTNIQKGRAGSGMATEIDFAVPEGSLEFWKARLEAAGVTTGPAGERFGQPFLPFEDPDGLKINLAIAGDDPRLPWITPEVPEAVALKGFHTVTLTVQRPEATARILEDIFGYSFLSGEGGRHRYHTAAVNAAQYVDLVEAPLAPRGIVAGGTNHHVAFRVQNDEVLMEYRERISRKGYQITPRVDRDYFFSLYFREPNGVLFELATDNPGFMRDETREALGSGLMLPSQYEQHRTEIEKVLPRLQTTGS